MLVSRPRSLSAFLVLCAFLLLPGGAQAKVDLDPLNDVKDDFNETYRLVRADHLLLPLSYLEVEGVSYGYQIPVRLREMARNGASFRIRKIKGRDNTIVFELESDRESRIKIRLFDVKPDISRKLVQKVAPEMLRDLFNFHERTPVPRVVGNTASLVAHVGVCNHLPTAELREEFQTVEACTAAGYRLCPACFRDDPPLPMPRYTVIRQGALEQARLFQVAFPLVEDTALQDSIQALGESLVETMPVSTKGFPYRFRVVQSELMQGTSFPTGFIFVTDRLLAAVEDEAELAHILAHEIVHTELHLPPNPQLEQPSIMGLAGDWDKYFAFLRWHESEADLLAIGMVGQALEVENPRQGGLQILRKLQFANEMGAHFEGDRFDSHPAYGSRLATLQYGYYPLDLGRYFEARNKDGEWVARFKILGAGWSRKGSGVLHVCGVVSPEAKEKLELDRKGVSALEFDDGVPISGEVFFGEAGKRQVVRLGEVEIQPGQLGTFVIRVDGTDREVFGPERNGTNPRFNPANIDRLELLINNGEQWVAVEGDW